MGSFIGHVLPGSFFIAIALWWTVQIFRRFYRSKQAGRLTHESVFTSSFTFPIQRRHDGSEFNVEAYVVIVCVIVGILIEMFTTYANIHVSYTGAGYLQHATMSFLFGFGCILTLVLPEVKVISEPETVVYIHLDVFCVLS